MIVATFYMIMLYSLAMPFLYFAGFFVMAAMYWSDKILFVKFFSTPPRYGTQIARRTYFILEFAIIAHFMFGIYMISNPTMFDFTSVNIDSSVSWA
jgi:hypothetical protein